MRKITEKSTFKNNKQVWKKCSLATSGVKSKNKLMRELYGRDRGGARCT
jgi:hypothetical protein